MAAFTYFATGIKWRVVDCKYCTDPNIGQGFFFFFFDENNVKKFGRLIARV